MNDETLHQGRYNAACGHIHRDEMASELRCGPDGEVWQVTGYCPGCTCHVDGRLPGSSTKSNWRQGVGLIEWAGSQVSITHLAIVHGRLVRVADLLRDLPEWDWG